MNFFKRFGADLVRVAFAAVLLAGIGSASGQVWRWSTTPGTNANADPSVNWAEGMAPSAVNDSARAMMASVAKFRDDVSGLLTSTGTSSAYSVSTFSASTPPTPPSGLQITFRPNATNAIGVTLSVDGGIAYPIHSSSGGAVAAGVLVSGSPYAVHFDGVAWLLHGFYGAPFNVPLGGVIDYTGPSSPNSNFIEPQGQCISRTAYATYFALVGTTYGACDGSTTFAVIDMRGRVAAGLDAGAGRLTCTAVSGCGVQSRALGLSELPAHTHTASGRTSTETFTHTHPHTAPGAAIPVGSDGPATNASGPPTSGETGTESALHDHTFSVTTSSNGGGAAFSIVQPTIPVLKLLRVL